jgi:hypothetical protein
LCQGYDEVQYMEELGTLDQVLFKEVEHDE